MTRQYLSTSNEEVDADLITEHVGDTPACSGADRSLWSMSHEDDVSSHEDTRKRSVVHMLLVTVKCDDALV